MSWIVSNQYKFIFIHIPKTGGTSIADPNYSKNCGALIGRLGPDDYVQQGHVRAAGLHNEINSKWDQYFKFSFVRNPWDRLVSLYHYFKQDEDKKSSKLGQQIAQCKDFNDFCLNMSSLDLDPHFEPQISYLIDYDGKYLMDYLGRFEEMQKHFDAICMHLKIPVTKLPHYRKSRHKNYKSYYNKRACEVVATRYESDIKAFGYNF